VSGNEVLNYLLGKEVNMSSIFLTVDLGGKPNPYLEKTMTSELDKPPSGWMGGYGGYHFFDSKRVKVGGAASTMHCKSRAQKLSNELNEPLTIYLISGSRWHKHSTVVPDE